MRSTGSPLIAAVNGFASTDVLAFAREWQRAADRPIEIVTVYPAPVGGTSARNVAKAAADRELASDVQAPARAVFGAEARYRTVPAKSAAAGLLEASAEEGSGSVLAVGSRTVRGDRRTAPGSTVEQLLRGASSTVVLVPWDYVEFAAPITQVAVLYTASAASEAAVDRAAAFAAELGAAIELIGTLRNSAEPGSLERAFLEDSLQLAAEGCGVPATTRMIDLAALPTEIDPAATGLLVSPGVGRPRAIDLLFGGATGELVRRSPVPLAVVPVTARG